MRRVALYVRVSTQEQKRHGLSVHGQLDALQKYADENHMQVVGVYNDAGISAHVSYRKRPAIVQMIEDCQNGKIDLILFTKLDRFFRSVKDYYAVMEKINVPWRAIWEDYDIETSSGQFKVNIMLSVAQSEADRTSDRLKESYQYRRSLGYFVGTPPLGYRVENHLLVKDEETAPYIELMFNTYLSTLSTTKTSKALADAGAPCLNANGLRKRLKHPAYYGEANGTKCEPYITKEQHDLIVDHFLRNSRNTIKKYDYTFRGLIICGYCGSIMRSSYTTINGYPCKHYKCTGNVNTIRHDKGISMSEKKLEKYLLGHLDEIVEEYNSKVDMKNEKSDNEKKKKRLEERLNRVGIRFEVGEMSVEEYKEKVDSIRAELLDLESASTNTKPISIPPSWKEMYSNFDVPHKNSFWHSIIKGISVTHETKKTPHIIWRV